MSRRQARQFRRLEKRGRTCHGCGARARFVDEPDGRQWFMPHLEGCSTLAGRSITWQTTADGAEVGALDDSRGNR